MRGSRFPAPPPAGACFWLCADEQGRRQRREDLAEAVAQVQLQKAAITSGVAAVLTFFGFMPGEAIGLAQTPTVAVAYVGVGLFLLDCAKFAPATETARESEPEAHHALPEPAE